jgi:8-oxo-dGTP pyrophosphatase MutT (NUDIX family)
MHQKNKRIVHEGTEYWISRSMAVAAFIWSTNERGEKYVLATKRGKGAADNHGKWCCPCGYLDYGETLVQAVQREVKEETGLEIDTQGMIQFGIQSDPNDSPKQNVTVRYTGYHSMEDTLSLAFCEPGEVEAVMWIPLKEVPDREWAFGHKNIILTWLGRK